MKTLIVKENTFHFEEAPDPTPHAEEVVVDVKAIGVNHADLLQRKGKYPPPPGISDILGLEVAGVVSQAGAHTPRFHKGDRVMCLLPGGGYSEKVVLSENLCLPIPHNLSFEEAAAIPETFLTAYQALFMLGEVQPKQWVLIHAGGSGVGTAALQLARAIGASVIATTRSKEKMEKCLELGADGVILTTNSLFAAKVLEITDGFGVNLILDFVGAPYYEENLKALSKGGALLFLSTLGGSKLELDLRLLMQNWTTLCGTTLRSRSQFYKEKLVEEFQRFALPKLESGELKPIIHTILPWEKVEEAHALLKENRAFGKVILTPAR